jgi:hypothetical protein
VLIKGPGKELVLGNFSGCSILTHNLIQLKIKIWGIILIILLSKIYHFTVPVAAASIIDFYVLVEVTSLTIIGKEILSLLVVECDRCGAFFIVYPSELIERT